MQSTGDQIEIDLALGDVLRRELLGSPYDPHWAGSEPDATFETLRITIGNKPIAVDLRELLLKGKAVLPEDMILFNEYQIWLVTYSVGVVKDGKTRPLDRLGFKVAYDAPTGREVTIIDVLPRSRFITMIGGTLQCNADLSVDGHAALPNLSDALPAGTPVSLGGRTSASVQANGTCRIGFEVASPQVLATGVASTAGEWIVERESTGLLGTHLFKHTLLVRKRAKELNAKVRVFGVLGGFFRVPVRIESKDVDLNCRLLN